MATMLAASAETTSLVADVVLPVFVLLHSIGVAAVTAWVCLTISLARSSRSN